MRNLAGPSLGCVHILFSTRSVQTSSVAAVWPTKTGSVEQRAHHKRFLRPRVLFLSR
jgi:hypothetical protein